MTMSTSLAMPISHPINHTPHGMELLFSTGRDKIPVIELILGPRQRVNHEVYRCHGVNPESHADV